MNLENLYGKSRTVLVGKHLPEEEQVEVTIYPIPLDEVVDIEVKESDTQEEKFKKTKRTLMLALHLDEASVGKIASVYIKDIAQEIATMMGTGAETESVPAPIKELQSRMKQPPAA